MEHVIDDKLVEEVLKTRKINKHKRTTAQSIRDHEKISQRMNNLGIKLDIVTAYFEQHLGPHVTAMSLLQIAFAVASKLNIKIDRLAKRNRTALFCWFAEQWNNIFPYLFISSKCKNECTISYDHEVSTRELIESKMQNTSLTHLDRLDINKLLN